VTSSASPEASDLDTPFAAAMELLIGPAARTGLAVSGGSDSIALLMLAARWAGPRDRTIEVATVDHGLRPEAAGEAAGVARLCARLGLRHAVLRWTPPPGGVSQAGARLARHRLLAGWAQARSLPAVALAHTADDRIETFLIRARAGSHWRGLAGPAPRAASPAWPEGAGVDIIRPVLWASRPQLRAMLEAAGRAWAEDPSNGDPRYERVRMRALASRLEPSAASAILRIMDHLAGLRAASEAGARRLLAAFACEAETASLEAGRFETAMGDVRRRALEALASAASGRATPPAAASIERLDAALAGAAPAALTLAGLRFSRKARTIRVRPAPPHRRATLSEIQDLNAAPLAQVFARAHALTADPCVAALDPVRAVAGRDFAARPMEALACAGGKSP
jgi:tRNA(Ile)-lysidine synthase